MPRYRATYWDNETASVEEHTQEFEGTVAEIVDSYFRIRGDVLGKLETPGGEVVYENMQEMEETEEECGGVL